jgi:hypothetical protein
MHKLIEMLPFIMPLIIIQLGLQIYTLVNLARRKRVRFNNKLIWVLIILLCNILGPIIYLIARGDDE